jgi:putative zincin peptidase
MNIVVRIFGWPHELLHVLALLLIGRRAVGVGRTHVDIPPDLTTRQYVFVAGLPALVFWTLDAACAYMLIHAGSLAEVALWLALTFIAALAAIGTIGDIYLIIARLLSERQV